MNIRDLIVSEKQAIGSDIFLITGIRPIKDYVDGKQTDKIIGFSYTIVCPLKKYDQFNIKVEQSEPVITAEELDAKGGVVKGRVKGFEGRFYQNKEKDIIFTAKAASIEVLNEKVS